MHMCENTYIIAWHVHDSLSTRLGTLLLNSAPDTQWASLQVLKTLNSLAISLLTERGFQFESQSVVNQNNLRKIRKKQKRYGRHVCDKLPCVLVSPVHADLTRRGALCEGYELKELCKFVRYALRFCTSAHGRCWLFYFPVFVTVRSSVKNQRQLIPRGRYTRQAGLWDFIWNSYYLKWKTFFLVYAKTYKLSSSRS